MSIGEPYQDENGKWMVPARAENEDGSAVGFGWDELTEDNPMYAEWVEYIAGRWAQSVADGIPS